MQSLMKSYWTPILLASFIILLMILIYVYQPDVNEKEFNIPQIYQGTQDSLRNSISDCLTYHQLSWKFQKSRNGKPALWKVDVPKDVAVPMIHFEIQKCIDDKKAKILKAPSNPVTKQVVLHVGWFDSVYYQIAFHETKAKLDSGKIALLIDDFGDRWDKSIESFCYLGGKISVSVLPGRAQSTRVAREMKKRGCDVLLHLPMQPKTSYKKMDYMITTELNQSEIQDIVHRAIQDVPGVVGMNNHMGSRVTENRKIMRFILEVIQAHDLYFVDSRTTPKSVGFQVARELNMPCSKKDIFIDNTSNRSDIQKWMHTLARMAQKKGVAIGIGHCHQSTLDVLREEIPRLQAQGFRFVTLSEVVQ